VEQDFSRGVLAQAPPGTLTGKALGYLNTQWPRLIRYLDDGRLEADNNRTENAIRPFVMTESLYTPCSSV